MYKKCLLIICLVICLFSIAGVCAGDADDNLTASDEIDIQEELSIQADEMPEADLSSADDASRDDLPLKANTKTFKDLNKTINGNNNPVIYLNDDYTFNIYEDTHPEDMYVDENYEILRYGVEINRPLTIYGNGHTLSANYSASAVFKAYSDSVTIYDVNFIDGFGVERGGAVYAKNNLTLINCNFTDSDALYSGAVYVEGTATVSNCLFYNNYAWVYDIGALYAASGKISNCRFVGNHASCYGAVFLGTGSVENCYFENNNAGNGPGGALYIERGGKIFNCTFKGNSAKKGGAVCTDGDAVISNSTFISNRAEDCGALALVEATVANCSFVGNTAQYNMGAIGMDTGSVINCSFVNNRAIETGSGAIYIEKNGNVLNCNFTNNTAESRGGAIAIGSFMKPNYSWSTKIVNCTFTNNKATLYGGALFGGTFTNCTFKGNSAKWGSTTYESKSAVYPNSIVATAISMVYNLNKDFVITLKDNNKQVLKNYKLDVEINGKSYVYTTNNNGQIKISTKNWSPKTYEIFISANGKNANYFSIEKSTRVVVNKALPKLYGVSKAFYLKDKTKKYVVTLKTNTNQLLKNVKVKVLVNGKTYIAKTNSKGQAIFSLNKLAKKGKFKATIKFEGNGYYKAVGKNVYLTVK